MQKGANVVDLFTVKHLKNQSFSLHPNYGGACRRLYIKFWFFKYAIVTYLIICNNLCLSFSNYFQLVKIWYDFKVISTSCFKVCWVVSKKILNSITQTYLPTWGKYYRWTKIFKFNNKTKYNINKTKQNELRKVTKLNLCIVK